MRLKELKVHISDTVALLEFTQASCSLPRTLTHIWTLKSCKTTASSCYGFIETGYIVFLYDFGNREWVLYLFHHNSLLFSLFFHCFLPHFLSFSSVAEWSHMGRWLRLDGDWIVPLRFSFFHFLSLSCSLSLSDLFSELSFSSWIDLWNLSVLLQSKQGRSLLRRVELFP